MVRSVDRSPFWIAVSKFWIVVRTMSSCDTAGGSSRVSSRVPRMATAASAAMTRTPRSPSPNCCAGAAASGSVASARNHLWRNGSGLCDGSGGGAGRGGAGGSVRHGHDLGGRLGRGLDDLRPARVESRRGGESAFGLRRSPRPRSAARLTESITSVSGAAARRPVLVGPSFSSVPGGFDIRASVLPRDYR